MTKPNLVPRVSLPFLGAGERRGPGLIWSRVWATIKIDREGPFQKRSLHRERYMKFILYCGCRWKWRVIIAINSPRYELNKSTSRPMCGFAAHLVEHHTGVAEVTGSNLVDALIFFSPLPSNCVNWKVYCDDHSSLSKFIPYFFCQHEIEARTWGTRNRNIFSRC